MEFTLRPPQEFVSPWKHLRFIIPLCLSVKLTFLLCDLASLLSIVPLSALVLKQALYCVCSAEQPASTLDVCVFVPASLSDCVNPLTGSPPPQLAPFFYPSAGLRWFALPSLPADLLPHLPVTTCSTPQGPITWEVTPPR